MSYQPELRGRKCLECGHALSSHNTLGYCQVSSKRNGECVCDVGTDLPTRHHPEITAYVKAHSDRRAHMA